MGYIILFTVLMMTAAPAFGDARITSWKELRPGEDIVFDDPFARLSPDQLRDLGTIARIRWLIANDKSKPDGVSAGEEERLVKQLSDQGVDVEWLLSHREKVVDKRRERLESSGSSVVDTAIRIPGYVMPLFPDQPEIRDFLLVPWVTPCAHFPPPAANQVIRVTIEPGMAPRDRFDPVWIQGTLKRKPSEYTIFLVDGVSRVEADFTLAGQFIGNYSTTESNVLAEGAMPASIVNNPGTGRCKCGSPTCSPGHDSHPGSPIIRDTL